MADLGVLLMTDADCSQKVEGGSIFARQSDDSPANVIGIPRLRQPPFRVDEKKFPPGSIRPAVCGIGAWSGCKRAADAEVKSPECVRTTTFADFSQQAGESSIPEHEPNNDIFDPIKFFNERVKENEAKYGNTPVLDRRSYEVPDGSVGIPDEVRFAPGTIRPAVCGFGYGNCKREAKPEVMSPECCIQRRLLTSHDRPRMGPSWLVNRSMELSNASETRKQRDAMLAVAPGSLSAAWAKAGVAASEMPSRSRRTLSQS